MIKCEVVKEFTLSKFNELKNIKRRRLDTKGRLYIGDTFECNKELVDYLMGNNKDGEIVVKVLEIIPEKNVIEAVYEEIKPNKKKKSKKIKKED